MSETRVFVGRTGKIAGGQVAIVLAFLGVVAILARSTDLATVGSYALALAIANPILLFFDFTLRAAIAADTKSIHRDDTYAALRERTTPAALVLILVIGVAVPTTRDHLGLLVGVMALKGADSYSNLYLGICARAGTEHLVARSMMIRAALLLALVTAGALLGSVEAGLIAAGLSWLLVVRADWRQAGIGGPSIPPRRVTAGELGVLVREVRMLGLDSLASTLQITVPRYTVEILLGTAVLGVYGTLDSATNGITVLLGSAGFVALPRLASARAAADKRSFVRLVAALIGISTVVGLLLVGAASTIGVSIAEFAFGPEFADRSVLVAVTAATASATVAQLAAKGLQAIREFRYFFFADLCALVTTVVIVVPMVDAFGAAGAGFSVAIGAGAGFVAAVFLLCRSLTKNQWLQAPVVAVGRVDGAS